ncbi:MAG: hypothetical protein IJW82_05620 [Clostridia bacterium]|nr:hypothetical protein [Clostridia bacterium]
MALVQLLYLNNLSLPVGIAIDAPVENNPKTVWQVVLSKSLGIPKRCFVLNRIKSGIKQERVKVAERQ